MPISLKCPKCGSAYTLKDELTGKQVKCKCGEKLMVAAQAPAAPMPPASAPPGYSYPAMPGAAVPQRGPWANPMMPGQGGGYPQSSYPPAAYPAAPNAPYPAGNYPATQGGGYPMGVPMQPGMMPPGAMPQAPMPGYPQPMPAQPMPGMAQPAANDPFGGLLNDPTAVPAYGFGPTLPPIRRHKKLPVKLIAGIVGGIVALGAVVMGIIFLVDSLASGEKQTAVAQSSESSDKRLSAMLAAASGAYGFDSPEAVFQAQKDIVAKQDFKKSYDICPADQRNMVAGALIAAVNGPLAGEPEAQEVARKHGVDRVKLHATASGFRELEDAGKQIANKEQFFIDVAAVSHKVFARHIGDQAMQKLRELTANATIHDLRIDGDSASGSVNGPSSLGAAPDGRMYYCRIHGRWFLDARTQAMKQTQRPGFRF